MYKYGLNQGAWKDQSINLSMEVAAFGKFTRQLVAGLSNIAGESIMYGIQFMDEGEDPMTAIGQQLNFYNQIMAKDNSGIKKVPDLSDARLGVPLEDSQTTRVVRAMILNEYDFDILKDPAKVNASDPPAIWNLFKKGELDAVLEFSGFTLAGNAADDIHTVFDSFHYWKERTGQPPSVADFIVKKSWLKENAQTALNYLNGWWDATKIFKKETGPAVQKYGELGGVTSKDQQKVVKKWVNDGIIAPLERGYSQELADSTYKLMQLLARYDLLKGVPDDPNSIFTTTDELKKMT